jgi:hypothetical protein
MPDRVFVLGAGFSRAFSQSAPLGVDSYNATTIKGRYRQFPHANRIIQLELTRVGKGDIDIERLLTRLENGMPYDADRGAQAELSSLLHEFRASYVENLRKVRPGLVQPSELSAFAKKCVEEDITCITFNGDDMFDAALSKYGWHPSLGYGFPMRSVQAAAGLSIQTTAQRTVCQLLKLHGSVNWRVLRGSSSPYSLDSILHFQDWNAPAVGDYAKNYNFETYLEPDPILIPPVLNKEGIRREPWVRNVWSEAYNALEGAKELYFLGYSFPLTDFASRCLFAEAIPLICEITFVIKPPPNQKHNPTELKKWKAEIEGRFTQVFPKKNVVPRFEDVLHWTKEFGRS